MLGADTTASYYPGGDGMGPKYRNWDAESTNFCVCDPGFVGSDCASRICPKGDDPMTTSQVRAAPCVL